MRKMSRKVMKNIKWDSSTEEEEDVSDVKFRMKLRESLRTVQGAPESEDESTTVGPSRRRGRGPSKRPCLNRNALMARENRQRKKAYLEKIEGKLSFYQQENKTLMTTIRKQGIDIKRLTTEVAYLRSVLNNNSNITVLLKTINDGLKRISALKKSTFHPNNSSQTHLNDLGQQHKCTCFLNVKENVLNTQNTNIFINTGNDHFVEQNGPQSQMNGPYTSNRRQVNCKNSATRKILSPFTDLDHTYTISKNSIVGVKHELGSKELENGITMSASSVSQGCQDVYVDNANDLDELISNAPIELCSMDEKKDVDMISNEFDPLPTFNMDIFEDLPKCDEILNTVDGLHDASNLFSNEDMFQSLDNTGICLHVNSDKVSLEFCSICQSNSKNAALN